MEVKDMFGILDIIPGTQCKYVAVIYPVLIDITIFPDLRGRFWTIKDTEPVSNKFFTGSVFEHQAQQTIEHLALSAWHINLLLSHPIMNPLF